MAVLIVHEWTGIGPYVQERIGQQISDTLNGLLKPHGVAVYLEARHLCVEMRGVKELALVTRTTFWRGNYDTDPGVKGGISVGLRRE